MQNVGELAVCVRVHGVVVLLVPQVVPIHLGEFMAERRYQDDAARSTFLQNQSVNGLANTASDAETVDSGSIPVGLDKRPQKYWYSQ